MRIISKQHDFYDFVSAYGVDMSVVYNRQIKSMGIDDKNLVQRSDTLYYEFERDERAAWRGPRVSLHSVVVMICGDVKKFYYRTDMPSSPFLDADSAMKLEPQMSRYPIGSSLRKLSNKRYSWWFGNDEINYDVEKIHEKYGSPILIFGVDYVPSTAGMGGNYSSARTEGSTFSKISFDTRSVIIDGPVLATMGLASFYDPMEIWANLEMWFSSNNTKIDEISDKSKIKKAGFDYKSSFRNMNRDG